MPRKEGRIDSGRVLCVIKVTKSGVTPILHVVKELGVYDSISQLSTGPEFVDYGWVFCVIKDTKSAARSLLGASAPVLQIHSPKGEIVRTRQLPA